MKIQIIISLFIVLMFASCDNSRLQDKQEEQIPKALEDNSSYEMISKRSDGDLVGSLYHELANKTPELKELEKKIENLSNSKSDSAKSFNNYNSKNQSYYTSANNHMEQMKDSVLRNKIKNLIAGSFTQYNSSVSRHNEVLKSIEAKYITLNDLHKILKITRTLPLIDKFQKDNLPSVESLEGFSRNLDKAIQNANTLSNK